MTIQENTAITFPQNMDKYSMWIQGAPSFRKRQFLSPSCHIDEFQAEFMLCIIKPLFDEQKISMNFFYNLKFLLIFWFNYLSHRQCLVMALMQIFWEKLGKPLEKFVPGSKSLLSSNAPFIWWSPRKGFLTISALYKELRKLFQTLLFITCPDFQEIILGIFH